MPFFQAQGQPVQQQQQQYSPVFQQPQNIYQQLGKPQPQPHLQSHPNYVQQQPPPIQAQGFQISQPQYAQSPPQAAQAPFPMSHSPFASPQTPYAPSQTPYLPTQTPFSQPFTAPQTPFAPQQTSFTQQQAPYPVSQTPYAPAQTPYPPPQQYPVQQAHHVPAQTQVPTSSFPNKASGMIPTNSAGTSWRPATTARPPPISPSATLAQHATAQQAQVALQTQQSPSTIQTPTRRPLPQPSGANAKTPVLPPANSLKRATTLASAKSAPGSSKPFPTVQPIQTTIPPSSMTPSPTRSRPLPTPTAANKRATVDLGQLASGSASPALSTTVASTSAFSATSSTSDKRSQSPTKFSLPAPPSLFQNKTNEGTVLSRTSSYAIGINKNPASTSGTSGLPSRRASPPRFQSNPSSSSSSPVKEAPPSTSWKTTTTTVAAKSIPPSSSAPSTSTNPTTDTKFSSSPTSTAPPKKFTPLWRRTIPEMPAPAWGYAAGMVSEPHPKPVPQTAQQQPGSPEKGKGKLQKKTGPPNAPAPSAAPTQLNTQYPKASTFEQRQSYYQQPSISQPPLSQPAQLAHTRLPAGYAPQGRQQQAQEQEETEEETEEDDEDEETDEEGDEDEEESDHLAQRRNRSHGRYGYESEQRAPPTKKILRPKEKVDPYGGYMDVSPIARKDGSGSPTKVKIRPKFRERVQRYQEELQDCKPKKVIRERESVEVRRHERSRSAFEEREIVRHRREIASERERPRPGSAFARRRKYNVDDDEDDVRLAYEDEDEDEEESEEEEWRNTSKRGAATGRTRERVREWERDLDRREGRDSRPAESPQWGIRDLPSAAQRRALSTGPVARYRDEYEEEEEYRHGPSRERVYRDEPDPGPRYRGGRAGLPQPPVMTREGRGSPEKSQGGPRRKTTPLKHHEDEDDQDTTPRRPANQGQNLRMKFSAINLNGGPNGNRSDSRGSSSSGGWPADLPRLPRTPGSATTPGGVSNDAGGYFDVRPPQQGMSPQGSGFRHNQVHGTPNQRPNLNIDDPPPRATIVRTPSPGPSGYTFKRELPQHPQSGSQSQAYPQNTSNEQLQRRRSLYSATSEPIHQEVDASPQRRPQSQIYTSSHGNSQPTFGHGQHQQPQQHHHDQSHPGSQPQLSFPDQGPQFSFNNRQQPQTPAPPALVGIESPHPIGGREKLADIPKLEEDSNDGSDHERTIPRINTPSSNVPRIHVDSGPPSIPMINIDSSPRMSNAMPMINVEPPRINVGSDSPGKQASRTVNRLNVQVFEVPGVSVSGPEFDGHHGGPSIHISDSDNHGGHHHEPRHEQHQHQSQRPPSQHSQFGGQQYGQQQRPGGLICGGCHGPIIGRIVSAMGSRWHPACFRCAVCGELLEHVSSYEHDGRPYCHLDYHENFAPRCYSCKTAIIEEQFISLDDPALGKRTYHTQHFFCAECGDPFLDPSTQLATDSNGELALSGDGEFEGFTVYKGHPYCEACHVRLRLPKCKRCKKSIRDHEEAVEALGGKWCWSCFVCASCHKPFEDPSFFQRGDQPYCEHCFSIMLRNEV